MSPERAERYKEEISKTISELNSYEDCIPFLKHLNEIRERIEFYKDGYKSPEILASSILKLLKVENKSQFSENIKGYIVELAGKEELYYDSYSAENLITQYSNIEDIAEGKRIRYLEVLFNSMPQERSKKFINSAMYQWREQFDGIVEEKEVPNSAIVLTAYYGSLKTDKEGEDLLKIDLPNHGLTPLFKTKEDGLVQLEVSKIEERISDIIQE